MNQATIFRIIRTSCDDRKPPVKGAKDMGPAQSWKNKPDDTGPHWWKYLVQDILAFGKEHGRIVIHQPEEGKDMFMDLVDHTLPTLEIYDDYRE